MRFSFLRALARVILFGGGLPEMWGVRHAACGVRGAMEGGRGNAPVATASFLWLALAAGVGHAR